MEKFKKNFFYIKELSSSSEDFENEYGSFSNPKVVGFPTNMQLRRGSTHSTTEPVTLNRHALAYLNQQHSDPGYNKSALAQRDQQHSDPDRIIQIKRDQQHSDPDRIIQIKRDQQHSDPDRIIKIKRDQQHSDPDRIIQIKRDQQHSDPGRFIRIQKDQQHSDPDRRNYNQRLKTGQVYLNPGYNSYSRVYNSQQHSDPGYDSNHRMTWLKLCCCFTEESTQVAPLNEFSINTRLKRQPSFRYHK
jgi:hypothetical protein